MQNSINIDHKKDLIFPSFDGSLWVKNTTKWESINQHLYKNENFKHFIRRRSFQ